MVRFVSIYILLKISYIVYAVICSTNDCCLLILVPFLADFLNCKNFTCNHTVIIFKKYIQLAILSFKNNGYLSRELQALFPCNLMHDPQHTLDGMLVLKCFFCNAFQTPIEYDMRVHLRYTHRKELITHLPIRGKGFNMDYRTDFVIDFLKRRKSPQFYDHRIVEFVPLDEP